MIKKSNLILALSIASAILVGCSDISTTNKEIAQDTLNTTELGSTKFVPLSLFELEDSTDENGFSKIKGYDNLKCDHIKDETRDIKDIILPTSNEIPSYSYDKSEKIKSLLGKDLELIPYNIPSGVPELYALKGYEEDVSENAKKQKYIYLVLQDKYDEEFGYPQSEKISFVASSSVKEDALKSMLSMKDKIKVMLDNLLKEEQSNEVLKFLEEEISRINANTENESIVKIQINQDMYLEYVYGYNKEGDFHYNRFSFHCRTYTNE